MLESLTKRVQLTKKICSIGRYTSLILFMIIMLVYKNNILNKFIISFSFLILCALFSFFGFTTLIREKPLLEDNVTFISGLFHNYLFINDELVNKRFAILNKFNTIKTDYKGHKLEVLLVRDHMGSRVKNYITFHIDDKNLNNYPNIEELLK